MHIKEFLNSVCEQIKYKPIRNEIAEELENHINETKEDYIKNGIHEEEAEEKAIMQMGEPEKIGKRLNKIHKPQMNWQLLILTIILLEFGYLVSYVDGTDKWKINLITIILTIIPCILIYLLDYRKMKKYANIFYIVATIISIHSVPNIVRKNYI